MMALLGLYNQLQNLWPFSVLRVDDLKLSDKLVRQLPIPEQTKQFVFALREPESGAVIYILCAQNLSERSARDTEILIREVRPDAVLVQVGATLPDYMFQEQEPVNESGKSKLVPTSAYSVLLRSFVDRKSKDEYENIAGSLVLKEIFGVGFYGHLLVAKKMSEKFGSSFLMLDAPLVKPNVDNVESPPQSGFANQNFQALSLQPSGSSLRNLGGGVLSNSNRFFTANPIHIQALKSLSSNLSLSLTSDGSSGQSLERTVPRSDYQPPAFAESVYPLLSDLHAIFSDVPSMGNALAYSQKMFDDIGRGQRVDTQVLAEVFTFQIAVEGLRVALNNSGRLPLNKIRNHESGDVKFSELPVEEQSSCLLSEALRSQTKNYKTIVAVIDAGRLAGVRKYWNMSVPEEIINIVEDLVLDNNLEFETSLDGQRRVLLKDKPVVALGAGATAILGASSLSKVFPASSVMKIVTLKIPSSLKLFLTHTHKAVIAMSKIIGSTNAVAPGLSGAQTSTALKAAVSAEKISVVTHSVIASAQKTSLSAMRTAFYEIMRKRRVQRVGFLPWATFGCSIATCAGLVAHGDGIECAVASLPAAPAIASLGRGIQNLQQASNAVSETSRTKIQKAMESLMYRLRKMKIQ